MPKPHPACLQAALEYLGRGWSVFPLCPPDHKGTSGEHQTRCSSPGKAPMWPWQRYQTTPPTAKELELLWARDPHAVQHAPPPPGLSRWSDDWPARIRVVQHAPPPPGSPRWSDDWPATRTESRNRHSCQTPSTPPTMSAWRTS